LDAGVLASGVAQIGLSGAGTELSVSGGATVADDGTGVLSVFSGATFSAASLTIGSSGDSSGALVVTGAGSTVQLSGTLNIGTALGTGDITVGPNASVHAGFVNLRGQAVLAGGVLDPTVQLIGQGQTAGGLSTISAGDIIDEGVIQASQRLLLVQGAVLGGGTLTINGTVQPSKPAGVLQINASGTLELTGAVLNAVTTTFTDNLTPADTYTVSNSVMDVTSV
jgi:T5SS/PEP-CTERM-associated repeat protein